MSNVPYEKITAALITALESGTAPWSKPWVGAGQPRNAFTNRAYTGINIIVLGMQKFLDPRWATFNQIRANGGMVRKGETATPVVFWNFSESTDRNGKKTSVPYLKYFACFNVEQADGLNLPPLSELIVRDNSPIEAAESIVAGYAGRPKIESGHEGAWYRPRADVVGMPHSEQFTTREGYYAVLFHELIHSTGHESRLNRVEVAGRIEFGSTDYSLEELVAEFGAYFLCSAAGITNSTLENNSAAYLRNWIQVLKGDVKMAVKAAGRAQKATNYILGIVQEDKEAVTEPTPAQELAAV